MRKYATALPAGKAAEVSLSLVSLQYAWKPKRQGKNRIYLPYPPNLGGLLRFDRSLDTRCSGGGAREHKGNLLVTIIYVRYHFENVVKNSLPQARGLGLNTSLVSQWQGKEYGL